MKLFSRVLRRSLLPAVVAALLAVPAAGDSTMRCDANIVTRGLTLLEVLERCGEPALTLRRAEFLVAGVYLPVEEWYYELGSNRFRRLLTFENGRLVRIEQRPKPVISVEEVFADR